MRYYWCIYIYIKHDVLHDILHVTKLVTAMKAARAALVGFFLSILAWRVPQRRSTPLNRTHIYRNSFRSICASLLFKGFFDKMQKSSASLQEVLQVVQIYSSTRECLRHQVGVDPLNDDVVIQFLSRDMLKEIQGQKWSKWQNPRNYWCFWTCFIFVFASWHFYYLLLSMTMRSELVSLHFIHTFPCGWFAFGRPTGVK